jgi:acetoin utilization protein AcuB
MAIFIMENSLSINGWFGLFLAVSDTKPPSTDYSCVVMDLGEVLVSLVGQEPWQRKLFSPHELQENMMDISITMTRRVIYLNPKDRLPLAHTLMLLHGFRHVPIVQNDVLLGIISDRDILRWSQMQDDSLVVPDIPIEHVMGTQPVTCTINASVAKVAGLMAGLQIDAVPIVDKEYHLIGLVTSTDLLELLANENDGPSRKRLPFQFNLESASSVPLNQ